VWQIPFLTLVTAAFYFQADQESIEFHHFVTTFITRRVRILREVAEQFPQSTYKQYFRF
jgi:hypothetical protein